MDEFERRLAHEVGAPTVSANSGTSATPRAYLLAGIRPRGVVLASLFTCTSASILLLHLGALVFFYDIGPATRKADVEDINRQFTPHTRAIVVVHFAGLPVDLSSIRELEDRYGLPAIEDTAHALGASLDGTLIPFSVHFAAFSFRAIKHITTGDGARLAIRDSVLIERAKRLRWFGIDREVEFGIIGAPVLRKQALVIK